MLPRTVARTSRHMLRRRILSAPHRTVKKPGQDRSGPKPFCDTIAPGGGCWGIVALNNPIFLSKNHFPLPSTPENPQYFSGSRQGRRRRRLLHRAAKSLFDRLRRLLKCPRVCATIAPYIKASHPFSAAYLNARGRMPRASIKARQAYSNRRAGAGRRSCTWFNARLPAGYPHIKLCGLV